MNFTEMQRCINEKFTVALYLGDFNGVWNVDVHIYGYADFLIEKWFDDYNEALAFYNSIDAPTIFLALATKDN